MKEFAPLGSQFLPLTVNIQGAIVKVKICSHKGTDFLLNSSPIHACMEVTTINLECSLLRFIQTPSHQEMLKIFYSREENQISPLDQCNSGIHLHRNKDLIHLHYHNPSPRCVGLCEASKVNMDHT